MTKHKILDRLDIELQRLDTLVESETNALELSKQLRDRLIRDDINNAPVYKTLNAVVWAEAIAMRITDRIAISNKEDRTLLREVLTYLFTEHPSKAQKLVGTTIIEADYFGD